MSGSEPAGTPSGGDSLSGDRQPTGNDGTLGADAPSGDAGMTNGDVADSSNSGDQGQRQNGRGNASDAAKSEETIEGMEQ